MKFKIDENLPLSIQNLLIAAGHDALTVKEQNLTGHPDPEIAFVCSKEGRIIVSLDMDFSDIRTYPPYKHAGIMVIRADRQDRNTVVEIFRPALDLLSKEPVDRKLWIIEKDRIRIRE
jgi:predicted nuclease of predicted toxin-antitoxin system